LKISSDTNLDEKQKQDGVNNYATTSSTAVDGKVSFKFRLQQLMLGLVLIIDSVSRELHWDGDGTHHRNW